MKWKTNKYYKSNDTREKYKFLLLPKCINGDCRWLTKESWIETYKEFETRGGKFGENYRYHKWVTTDD